MGPAAHGDEVAVGEARELVDLLQLLDQVSDRMAALDGGLDAAGERAGSTPSAQENRVIGGARAHLARRHALEMRDDLDEVRRQASEMVERSRASQAQRRAAREPAVPPAGPTEDPPASATRAVARDLVDVHDRDEIVERALAGARRALPASCGASLRILDRSGASAMQRASDPVVGAFEERQRRLACGPVLEVLRSGTAMTVDDLAGDARWPQLAGAARELGLRSLVAVALPGRWAGAVLACYADGPRPFDAEALHAAGAVADLVAVALSGARRVAGLSRALETRDVIGQAKGILTQRDGLSSQAAFEKLVEASQHANLKVADVARWMVGEGAAGVPSARP